MVTVSCPNDRPCGAVNPHELLLRYLIPFRMSGLRSLDQYARLGYMFNPKAVGRSRCRRAEGIHYLGPPVWVRACQALKPRG